MDDKTKHRTGIALLVIAILLLLPIKKSVPPINE